MSNELLIVKDYKNIHDNQPVVSVVNWVFNQSNFIEESLESILNQKVGFSIEIIVQDDASTDGTREILDSYIAQYPNIFNCILNNDNKYSKGEDITTPPLLKARGKYIALICGDDYWTDPLKLQKQIDFLEQNPEYNVVGGGSKIYSENSKTFRKTKVINYNNGTLSVIEYLFKRPFQTATIVFRNEFKLPNWFSEIYPGDKFLVAFAADKMKLKVLDDVLAVYRVNDGGITSNLTKNKVTELLKRTNYGLSRLYDYIPESDHDQLTKLINHNEVLIQFGSTKGINKLIVFFRNFTFLCENRNWINWKVFLSRLK